MDEDQELLSQLLQAMPPETRFRMQKFIVSVGLREECALKMVREIEMGRLSPKDALEAFERCQEANH